MNPNTIVRSHIAARISGVAALAFGLIACATQTTHAQIGSGWTQYTATKTIHLDNEDGLQTFSWTLYKSVCSPTCADYRYDSATGVETFRLVNNSSNRSEIRLNNNYTSGRRQFEGQVRVSTPTNEEAVHQVFGGATHATAMQVRASSNNGGELRDTTSGAVMISGIYGVWVRINTIHDADVNKLWAYANGSLKSTHSDNGNATHYNKYGCYGTLTTASAKVEWKSIKTFRDGQPTGGSGVTFYQNTNYGGTASQSLAKGNYTLSQLQAKGVPNDWASSARIPSGWTVIIYQNGDFSGTSWTRTSDTPDFTAISGLNDQMSSCRIQ